ncbi:hypothetical protein BGZ73_003590 [Actinomortierella ambigua]|nr:hypothetical protein BGZ73_003590 [Actinomortierella ambigua]
MSQQSSPLQPVDAVAGARDKVGDILRDPVKQTSYQILDVLGYGTYGCIYLAKTMSLPVEFKAIKCLSKRGLSMTQLLLQRQEIDIHLSLSDPTRGGPHPHIVDMSSVIETKDSLYLIMEYCSGGDLYDAITSQHAAARDSGVAFASSMPANVLGRCLDVHSDSSVLDAMQQIISALAYSHSRQVFHRDLKPENVLVANDGSLKLADFGLATKDRISSDFGCGSSFYMAPEQQPSRSAAGRRPYLPAKSDVWSLGIIFLNLRFGRNPWKLSRADSDPTFAAYIKNPNILADMFPELSPAALHFLHRVLCVDPNDRADCYEALELIQGMTCIVGHGLEEDDATAAAMEGCEEESSDIGSMQSSVESSRNPSATSSIAASMDGYYDDDDQHDEMFHMEDDYGAPLSTGAAAAAHTNNSDSSNDNNRVFGSKARSGSRLSNWSLASHQSGHSWSDMAEEEAEMDFSLPVEFDEPSLAMKGGEEEEELSSFQDAEQQIEQQEQQQQQKSIEQQEKTPAMMMMMKESFLRPNDHPNPFDDDLFYSNNHHHYHHSYSHPVQVSSTTTPAVVPLDHAMSVSPWMVEKRDATLPTMLSLAPTMMATAGHGTTVAATTASSYPYYPTTESWSISSGLTLNPDPLSPTTAMTFADAYSSSVPTGGGDNPLKVAGFTKLSDLLIRPPSPLVPMATV